MSPLITVPDHITQARKVEGLCPPLPWNSFADFFKSRVYDRTLINRTVLDLLRRGQGCPLYLQLHGIRDGRPSCCRFPPRPGRPPARRPSGDDSLQS